MKRIQSLKPFFDFKLRQPADLLCLLLAAVLGGLLVFNAFGFGLTYDEAYTYLNLGRISDAYKIFLFRIANNHVLNSLLITVSTLFFPFNEFAIRLPSLLFGLLYLFLSISVSKTFRNRFIVFGLLVSSYFLLSFFSLGRGYGMSACLVLAALYVYQSRERFKNYYLWIAYLFILGFYANFVAIAPLAGMLIYLFVFEFKLRLPSVPKKHYYLIGGLLAFGLWGFFLVTKSGNPIYGAYDTSFSEAIGGSFLKEFSRFLNPSSQFLSALTMGFSILTIGLFIFFKHRVKFSMITLITFLLVLIMAKIGDRPLPTGRVLLPFWPLVVLSIMELFELASQRIHIRIIYAINIVVLVALMFNLWDKVSYNQERYVDGFRYEHHLYDHFEDIESHDPHLQFYKEKDRYFNIVPKKLLQFSPTKEVQYEYVNIKLFEEQRVVLFSSPNPEMLNLKLFIDWQLDGSQQFAYSDTLEFKEEYYEMDDDYYAVAYLPNFTIDQLSISDTGGNWEFLFKQKMHL